MHVEIQLQRKNLVFNTGNTGTRSGSDIREKRNRRKKVTFNKNM